jgi:hypothetical protein
VIFKIFLKIRIAILKSLIRDGQIIYEGKIGGKNKVKLGNIHLHEIARKHNGKRALLIIGYKKENG